VYTVVSALDVPFDSECPPCPPNSNEACPALRAVQECPADLPTEDCRADEFKDGFAVFPVGTLCAGRGECDTEKRLDNCGSKSVYEVMSIGKQCPYLELIDSRECPASTEDLQTCHSPCLCEGDLCRGKGDSARHCGAAAGVDNCGDEGVYRVVSTAYMPRSNCGQCTPYVPPPVPGPTEKPISSSGYEDDYIVSANCPILAALKPGSCPAVITNINCDTPGLQPGDLCEADGECGTDKGLNNCDGVNEQGADVTGADIYIVVPGIDQPTPAPTRNFFVQTSVRFKTDLLDDLAPAWKQDALLLKQIGRALVNAGVADVTYDAAWETKPDIPSRRRLDYGSVAAVVNVGLYEPELNDAGRADPALHVQKLLQFAARAVTEPSLKKALRKENEALEKSCDYEQTALFAPEDTQEGTAPPGQPTAPPFSNRPTRQPTREGEDGDEDEDESEGGRSKKKKSDDDGDAGMIAGIVIACLVALCLCGAAVAYFAQNKKGSSAFKSQSRREAPPPPLPETELGTYSTYSDNVDNVKDDPHRVDSNPIVEAAADDEHLDDVDIAPGGGDEY
jgi:hypothetical protein